MICFLAGFATALLLVFVYLGKVSVYREKILANDNRPQKRRCHE